MKRMVSKRIPVIEEQVPREHLEFAARRVSPLLEWWGRFIECYTLGQLAQSCYLQGVADCFAFVSKRGVPAQEEDWSI